MLKKWLQLLKKDERGLTLVELLAVIVILAIVGAIAFVAIGNVMENSRQDAHIANAQQLISSAKLYEASGNDIPLTGGSGTVTSTDLVKGGFLDALVSPWDDTDYSGTVTKTVGDEGGVSYSVTLNGEGCSIDNSEEDIKSGDRDSLCD
ncbi:type II secretion system protein [Paucisalibacillus globulus]|uniref:type II secretion system protein n=1 Tax=Paucisalibacillus globulus TaxID=351095 RepID=UPI00040A71A2|nr:type II secretion system protein [Paucisalibacillus globulus]